MLTFLQISDIHFLGLPKGLPRDLDRKLRHRLVRDARKVAKDIGGVSGILISGDVAFSGTEPEYKQAAEWLREVAMRLGIDPADVWVIPGNHDIQRDVTKTAVQRVLRSTFRVPGADVDACFDAVLKDATKAGDLIAPLANYNVFASQFGCEISGEQPFWEDRLPLAPGLEFVLHGLSSPLISDEHDAEEAEALALGSMQTAILIEDGEVHVSMCHHPFNWLLDGSAAQKALEPHVRLHLSGHEHQHSIHSFEKGIHLSAGALQPERKDPNDWEPRYNFLSFKVVQGADGTDLLIRVHVRVWDEDADGFVADAAYADGVFDRRVPLDEMEAHEPFDAEDTPAAAVSSGARQLRQRLALLASGDRFLIARELKMDLRALAGVPLHEVPSAMIEQASEASGLADLWDEVERFHGTQIAPENPFR
jgi:hypothetical protein